MWIAWPGSPPACKRMNTYCPNNGPCMEPAGTECMQKPASNPLLDSHRRDCLVPGHKPARCLDSWRAGAEGTVSPCPCVQSLRQASCADLISARTERSLTVPLTECGGTAGTEPKDFVRVLRNTATLHMAWGALACHWGAEGKPKWRAQGLAPAPMPAEQKVSIWLLGHMPKQGLEKKLPSFSCPQPRHSSPPLHPSQVAISWPLGHSLEPRKGWCLVLLPIPFSRQGHPAPSAPDHNKLQQQLQNKEQDLEGSQLAGVGGQQSMHACKQARGKVRPVPVLAPPTPPPLYCQWEPAGCLRHTCTSIHCLPPWNHCSERGWGRKASRRMGAPPYWWGSERKCYSIRFCPREDSLFG